MKTLIFGTNEIASLAKFYLESDSSHTPVAFCIDGEFLKETQMEGLPIVPYEEIKEKYSPDEYRFFAPLYDNRLRKTKTETIQNAGYQCISYISSKATVWTENIGSNCFIMENNVIQPYVTIGNNVILWSGNHIGHHSIIKNNIFFASHVVLSGKCTVNDYAWFGVNSTIRDGITIAQGTFVAMGAAIIKDTNPFKKYIGNPAQEYGDVV